MIYLDNAATTKPDPKVINAILPYLHDKWYNPSALYINAKTVHEDIEKARKNIAKFIGAGSDEIYFTSGATESNNWVIRGFRDYCTMYGITPIIMISNIEHKSIESAVNAMIDLYGSNGFYTIPVDENGFIDIDYLETKLQQVQSPYKKYQILVSIQFANSEIGTIQHIDEISELVHKYGGIFHTDATQAFGHVYVDVKDAGIDLLSASSQKCGGLKGTGILYKSKSCNCISPLIYGAQEKGERGGTENVIGIIAMSKAVDCCFDNLNRMSDIINIQTYFIHKLIDKFNVKINGHYIETGILYRLPNNINVTFPQNITGEALIYLLDIDGVMIAAGSACNSNTNKPSKVLQAIGLTNDEILRTIRITLSDDITKEQIDTVIDKIDRAIKILTN